MENFQNYSRISRNEIHCSRIKFRILELEIEISFENIKALPEKNLTVPKKSALPYSGWKFIKGK